MLLPALWACLIRLLCVWVQVRAVARKAAALREAERQLAAAEAAKVAKEEQVVQAKEVQVGLSQLRGVINGVCLHPPAARPPLSDSRGPAASTHTLHCLPSYCLTGQGRGGGGCSRCCRGGRGS